MLGLKLNHVSKRGPCRKAVKPVANELNHQQQEGSVCMEQNACEMPHLNVAFIWSHKMMTPSNGNIFRVTGLLCGEFTGHR